MSKRNYLFDNEKVLLILLVVMGHFIEPCYQNNAFLLGLRWWIFSFHMPAFLFVSGYFTKKPTTVKKLIRGIVIPYFVYEIVYYLLYVFVLHKETGLYFARPKFSLWYLMALFAYKAVGSFTCKYKKSWMVAIIVGLLGGLLSLDNLLSIPRILYFSPFFFAGQCVDEKTVLYLKEKWIKLVSALWMVIWAVIAWSGVLSRHFTTKILYGRYSYADMKYDVVEGMAIRLVCYLVSFMIIFALVSLIPEKKLGFSYIGTRTMAVYIFHGLLYSFIKGKWAILEQISSFVEVELLILFCIAVVFVLSTKPFVWITDRIAKLI